MKLITVNASTVAMILKRGKLTDIVSDGIHWIGFRKSVRWFDITLPFTIDTNLSLILEDNDSIEQLKIVKIKDYQIGIEYKNGSFNRVLGPGKIGYWNSAIEYNVEIYDTREINVSKDIPKYILNKPQLRLYSSAYTVESQQKGLLFINGEFKQMLDSGMYHFWKTENIVTVKIVDIRIQSMSVVGQELLTKDKAGIRINFNAQYQVVDINKAVIESKDYINQLYTAFQLILREYIGTLTLDQLLLNKDSIGKHISEKTSEQADILGIKILSGGIKDVILPGDVKEIMNQVLIAQKKAQANTIMRQEETASTRSLLNTAKLMQDNAMLLKLKEMEYMEKIAEKIGEITVNGGSRVMDQLSELVIAK